MTQLEEPINKSDEKSSFNDIPINEDIITKSDSCYRLSALI